MLKLNNRKKGIKMITIDKNVSLEMPSDKIRWSSILRKMEVGDSFECDKKFQNRFCPIARQCEVRVTTKSVSPKTIRVWRIE